MRRDTGRQQASFRAGGGPLVWLMGAGLALAILMISGLLLLVVVNGTMTFWPNRLLEVELAGGAATARRGDPERDVPPRPRGAGEAQPRARGARASAGRVRAPPAAAHRQLRPVRHDFRWVTDYEIAVGQTRYPPDAWFVERQEWGPFVGYLKAIRVDGAAVASSPAEVEARFRSLHPEARRRYARSSRIERDEVGEINDALEELRLDLRGVELAEGKDSAAYRDAEQDAAEEQRELEARFQSADRGSRPGCAPTTPATRCCWPT